MKTLHAITALMVAAAFSVPAYPQATRDAGNSGRDIAKKIMPSVVAVHIGRGLGSGFFVKEGVIATNVHVIRAGVSGYVNLPDQKEKFNIDGVVGMDIEHDLVLLSIQKLKAPPLPLAEAADLAQGDLIYAVGSPEGLEGTFAQGNISAVARKLGLKTFLQISAPISPGSSGGPIVDAKGTVVGIAVASMIEGQNLNLAIPVSHLAALLKNLRPVRSLAEATRGLAPVAEATKGPGHFPTPYPGRVPPMKVEKTEVVGGEGGFPLEFLRPHYDPVIGVRYKLSNADGHHHHPDHSPQEDGQSQLLSILPVYEEPDGGDSLVVAKKGYVVGGISVNSSKVQIFGFQVTFVRFKDGRVDPSDSYQSRWVGESSTSPATVEAKDKIVVGLHDREAFKVVSLGLILASPAAVDDQPPMPPSPVDDKLSTSLQRTEVIGLGGNAPFVSKDPKLRPIIGFRYKLGGPRDQDCEMLEFEPLYEDFDGDGKFVMAKKGYAVGGVVVDYGCKTVAAVRVTFMRLKDGQLDPSDSYKSDWVGDPTGVQATLLPKEGLVVGVCGLLGDFNKIASLGLVLAPPGDSAKK